MDLTHRGGGGGELKRRTEREGKEGGGVKGQLAKRSEELVIVAVIQRHHIVPQLPVVMENLKNVGSIHYLCNKISYTSS